MKNVIAGITIGVIILTLSGCADHTAAWMERQGQINNDNKAVLSAYFSQQAARDSIILSKVDDPTALAMYSMMQGQRDAQVAGLFRVENIERPTNGWDVGKVFVGSTVPTLIKWGFGYLAADSLISALAVPTYNVGGDYTNMNADLNATGDMSDIDLNFDTSVNTGVETVPLDFNPLLVP